MTDYKDTRPGFVIPWPNDVSAEGVTEANANYIARWLGDPWYTAIKGCHLEMMTIDPQYRIDQVKEKFWELRYYFTASDPMFREALTECVRKAERHVAALNPPDEDD